MKTNIPKIAITGGPCAGKTTALAYLQKRLTSMGLHPLLVPESATTTILGGVRPKVLSNVEFQKAIITLQLSMEDYFERLAELLPEGTRPVLICDRGTLDSKAFCTPAEWKRVLIELGTNEVALRDERYQAVIHMVTAADGALDCYTLANNKARTETPQQARKSDRRLQQAWLHHAHLRVIANVGDFAHKISEVGAEVLKALGLPVPIEEERKFVLPPDAIKKLLASGIKCASVEIEQTYLLSPQGEERRLRRRSQGTASAYFHCIKSPVGKGKRIERERIITSDEFNALLSQRDPAREVVRKTRYCYLYKNQYQELDSYIQPHVDFAILEVETDGPIHLPPFFAKAKEVTGDPKYSNAALAETSKCSLTGASSRV